MYFNDSHIHVTDVSAAEMQKMYLAGVREVVSPVQLAGTKAVSSEVIREMWDYQISFQLPRVKKCFIEAYAMIGISMVSTPKDDPAELYEILPEYLKRPQVVAIGEIGFEPNSRTCKDLGFQEELLRGQLQVAAVTDARVVIHVPNKADEKVKYTEKSLTLCNEYKVPLHRVVIDHCTDVNLDIVLKSGAYAAITVQPWRPVSPEKAADMILKFGTDRIMINSDCGTQLSDPLAVPKTALELKKKGAAEQDIEMVCRNNSRTFYGI